MAPILPFLPFLMKCSLKMGMKCLYIIFCFPQHGGSSSRMYLRTRGVRKDRGGRGGGYISSHPTTHMAAAAITSMRNSSFKRPKPHVAPATAAASAMSLPPGIGHRLLLKPSCLL